MCLKNSKQASKNLNMNQKVVLHTGEFRFNLVQLLKSLKIRHHEFALIENFKCSRYVAPDSFSF